MTSYVPASPSLLSACFSEVNRGANPLPVTKVNALLTRIETQLALPPAFLSHDPLICHKLALKMDKLVEETGSPAHKLKLLEADITEMIVDILGDIKVMDTDSNILYGTFQDTYSVYEDNQRNMIYKELSDFTDDDDDIDDTESLMEIRSRHLRKHSSPVSVDFEEHVKVEVLDSAKKTLAKRGFFLGEILEQIEDHYLSVEQNFSVVQIKLDSLRAQNLKDKLFLHNLTQSNNELGERLRLIRHELEAIQSEINSLKGIKEVEEPSNIELSRPLMPLPGPPLVGLGLQAPVRKTSNGTATFSVVVFLITALTVVISYVFGC